MKLSIEQVQHVARLARLTLSDAEASLFQRQLSSILDAFDVLASVDTNGVEAMAHVVTTKSEDVDAAHTVASSAESNSELSEADVFQNAPARVEQSFSIPLVIE